MRIEEAQCNTMEIISNKHVTVSFDRVTLVRMGRPDPQERRERRYDTEFINTAARKTPHLIPQCTARNRYVVTLVKFKWTVTPAT